MAGHVPIVVAIVPGPLRYRLISENETNKTGGVIFCFRWAMLSNRGDGGDGGRLVEHIDVERLAVTERAEKRINNPAATERGFNSRQTCHRRAKRASMWWNFMDIAAKDGTKEKRRK